MVGGVGLVGSLALTQNRVTRMIGSIGMAVTIAILQENAAQVIVHPLEDGGMFQDIEGTIPVTASGQPLGRVLDAGGGGFHATAMSDIRRGTFRDEGGLRWVDYGGAAAYQTPVLPAPGADKVQVFAGLRKLSDATAGTVAELSPNTGTNTGTFAVFAPSANGQGNYMFRSRGSTLRDALAGGFAAPTTNVITGLGDTSGSFAILRVDGSQVATQTDDQGAFSFNAAGTYRIYYGARAGTTLFLNARHYGTLGVLTRFSAANATPDQIAEAEAYYRNASGLVFGL